MVKRIFLVVLFGLFVPQLEAADSGFVQLTWEPNSEPFLAGYVVYRSGPGGGAYQRINEEPIAIPQFEDFGLEPDRIYHYRVGAVGSDGREGYLSDALAIQAPLESEAPNSDGSTPVIEAAEGQLVILSPQRFGAELDNTGVWTQLSGPAVVLIAAGEGTATFRVPLEDGQTPFVFRYIVPGAERSGGPTAGGHHDVRVVGSPRARR